LLGYLVAPATSGRAALDILGSGNTFDLLMADYAMPGISGIELARAARARRPDLPVVIVTGYADAADLDGQIEGAVLLKKPYRLADVAAAVETALRFKGSQGKRQKIVTLRPRAS
jgi:CheY-like chemotaxis protein